MGERGERGRRGRTGEKGVVGAGTEGRAGRGVQEKGGISPPRSFLKVGAYVSV